VTAAALPPRGRWSPTLRATLLGAGVLLMAYVAAAVISLLQLMPHARALGTQGVGLAAASRAMHDLDSSLEATGAELLAAAADVRRSGRPLDAGRAERLRLDLHAMADSAWTMQANRLIGPVSPVGRITLARAVVAEGDALVHLVDAQARLTVGQAGAAVAAVDLASEQRREMRRHLADVERLVLAELGDRERRFGAATAGALRFTASWAVVGLVLVAGVAVLVYRRLYRPLRQLERGLTEVAAGNLAVELPVRWADELGRLQAHFNEMTGVVRARASVEARRARNLAERLGCVLDESSNEVYIFDAETWRLSVANRSARRNLGYAEQQLAALTPLDLLPDFARERFAAILATLRDGQRPRVLLATRHRRADGSTYPVELTLQYSVAEDPPVFLAVAQDISERTRIEAERDLVFERSADLMGIGSLASGRLSRVNPAWVRTLGFGEADVVAQPLLEFVHADDQALARRQLEQLAVGSPIRGTAIRMRCRDGGYRWISWNIEPSRDGVVYAIGRDVTDRRRAESRQAELQAAVARSAREWRMTFDALDDPMVMVNHVGEVTRLNEAARRLAGQSHADVLGRGIAALEPVALWGRAGELVERVRASGRPASSQVRTVADGHTWDVRVHPVAGPLAGRAAAIVIAHDVTAVVRLQDSVRRNEAMAAMGALVAGVAHEVRNPLFSMTATLDAFEARQGAEQAGQRHIRVLRTQLGRLQQLMRELLDYGRPPQLAIAPIVFDDVARQALDESALVARERCVTVSYVPDPALPAIRADRDRLVQVYVNLLTNAIHHSPQGTGVIMRARRVAENGGEWLEATVEDSGSGFRAEDLPRVFEPFFSRRAGGTGLGLALVQRIVEQHGGAVAAGNRPVGGAQVTVRLPLVSR
jgi:PAS domain S-box-containing protein